MERDIKELKKRNSWELLEIRALTFLWDDCLESEAYIRYNTIHDIYKLETKVPKTVMSGETQDISQFHKLQWFKWGMFHGKTAPFPDDMLKVGL